jgi:hypothetical protein
MASGAPALILCGLAAGLAASIAAGAGEDDEEARGSSFLSLARGARPPLEDPQLLSAASCLGPLVLSAYGEAAALSFLEDLAKVEEAARRAASATRRSLCMAYSARRRLFATARGTRELLGEAAEEDVEEFTTSVNNAVYNVEQDLDYAIERLATY